MRLVGSRPGSRPLPADTGRWLSGVTPDLLRELVVRVAVPRPGGSPGHAAARQTVTGLLSEAVGGGGVAVDPAGNVVAGDPRTARVLVGAHYDAVPGTPPRAGCPSTW